MAEVENMTSSMQQPAHEEVRDRVVELSERQSSPERPHKQYRRLAKSDKGVAIGVVSPAELQRFG